MKNKTGLTVKKVLSFYKKQELTEELLNEIMEKYTYNNDTKLFEWKYKNNHAQEIERRKKMKQKLPISDRAEKVLKLEKWQLKDFQEQTEKKFKCKKCGNIATLVKTTYDKKNSEIEFHNDCNCGWVYMEELN